MKHVHWLLGLSLAMLGIILFGWQQPATADSANDETIVVHIYYNGQQALNDLASWREPWEVNAEAGYIIVETTRDEIAELRASGLIVEIDAALTAEINAPRLPNSGGGIPGYSCYRTVEETFASAEQMALNNPDFATWTDIGDSWDKLTLGGPTGYDINVLKLTNSNIPGPKPKLMILGSVHAREYTTAETATRFAEYLLNNYGTDPDVTWLLDYHEVHLVLVTNPDGRKIAEAGQLWRKNRNNSDGCVSSFGVDLNRNFQFYWNNGGSSGDPCSETYRGSGAASEPETQAVQNYVLSIIPDQREPDLNAAAPITTTGVMIDLHSYGQETLWPWGFTSTPPANNTGIRTLARKMGFFNGYAATQSLYATSGSTKDFAYGELGIPAYTIEMGTAFFQSCSYYENTMVGPMMNTLLYAAKASRFSYITPAGPDVVNLNLSASSVPAGTMVDITAQINDTRYNGAEPAQNIVAAEYYFDVPPWITTTTPISVPLTAVDGTFNSTIEAVAGTIDTSTLSNGQHLIFVRGLDAAGNWGAISSVFLDVLQPATAVFSHTSPIITSTPLTFTNQSTGTNLSYLWDFGDGTTSSDLTPTHVFTQAGAYTITLTVQNAVSSDSASSIVVVMDVPVAQFSSTAVAPVGSTLAFTNLSTGTDLSYLWDFGDGSTSTDINPSHSFSEAGSYTITLTAVNAVGIDEATAVIDVTEATIHIYLPFINRND